MNKKIIITSEMRVGSRWLHYLLKDLYNMDTSPEIDRRHLNSKLDVVRDYMHNARIVKYHHVTQDEIFEALVPHNYYVIGVVRNPRDRGVSRAFHARYDRFGKPQNFNSDQEAILSTIENQAFVDNTKRMLDMMQKGASTYSGGEKRHTNSGYIWTSYEWMKQDIQKQVREISDFLGIKVTDRRIEHICEKHSFKNKSGRKPGEEKRNDRWRRKGIIGDWINWFNPRLLNQTADFQHAYWQKLLGEK